MEILDQIAANEEDLSEPKYSDLPPVPICCQGWPAPSLESLQQKGQGRVCAVGAVAA